MLGLNGSSLKMKYIFIEHLSQNMNIQTCDEGQRTSHPARSLLVEILRIFVGET